MNVRVTTVAATFLMLACGPSSKGAPTPKDAIQITNAQMAKDSPQIGLHEFIINTSDLSDRWEVTYDVPGGSTGTPIVFEVDKKSAKIVFVHRNQ